MKVLVVDDHATVRYMAIRLLGILGHQALEARDAVEAEDAFTKHRDEVGVVLLDVCLEGSDGAELARRLQATSADLHILFMSGLGEEVFASPDLAGPRRAFIEKPFSLRRLQGAIETLLAG